MREYSESSSNTSVASLDLGFRFGILARGYHYAMPRSHCADMWVIRPSRGQESSLLIMNHDWSKVEHVFWASECSGAGEHMESVHSTQSAQQVHSHSPALSISAFGQKIFRNPSAVTGPHTTPSSCMHHNV